MLKNMLKNSIYAEMWRENPQFREGMKRSFQLFALAVFLFAFGSVKGCTNNNKETKVQEKSVQTQKTVNTQSMLNTTHLFKQKQR